ncbi:MAG: alpha/beta hydrolase [Planctomycetota bacterium]|nr:alpha/beta hydrolase [Planctomycetota bacterium]
MGYIVSTLLAFSVACLAQTLALAAPPEIILWTDGVPDPVVPSDPPEKTETAADGLTRRFNVSNPRLFVHSPAMHDSNPRAAVIVVPGGGFGRLADEHEGSDVCTWLNAQGIVAFQLAYRTPTNKQTPPESGPVQDLRRAISIVRARAAEFQVDPDRIGAMGFSAGGLTTFIAAGQPNKVNSAVDDSTKLNAVLLIYPWRIWDEELNSVHAAMKLDAAFPPTFIAQSADDTASSAVGSARVFLKLTALKVPVEFHIYEKGGHGFGMRPRAGAPGTRDWQNRAHDWLQLRGFINTAP